MNRDSNLSVLVDEKLTDLDTPGAVIEMDPEEAELAGAFMEEALGNEDALDAMLDDRKEDPHE